MHSSLRDLLALDKMLEIYAKYSIYKAQIKIVLRCDILAIWRSAERRGTVANISVVYN